MDSLLNILEKRHNDHARNGQCRVNIFIEFLQKLCFSPKAQFDLEVDPLEFGPDKIMFKTCDTLDELLLVINFMVKHKMKVTGKLFVTFFR